MSDPKPQLYDQGYGDTSPEWTEQFGAALAEQKARLATLMPFLDPNLRRERQAEAEAAAEAERQAAWPDARQALRQAHAELATALAELRRRRRRQGRGRDRRRRIPATRDGRRRRRRCRRARPRRGPHGGDRGDGLSRGRARRSARRLRSTSRARSSTVAPPMLGQEPQDAEPALPVAFGARHVELPVPGRRHVREQPGAAARHQNRPIPSGQ